LALPRERARGGVGTGQPANGSKVVLSCLPGQYLRSPLPLALFAVSRSQRQPSNFALPSPGDPSLSHCPPPRPAGRPAKLRLTTFSRRPIGQLFPKLTSASFKQKSALPPPALGGGEGPLRVRLDTRTSRAGWGETHFRPWERAENGKSSADLFGKKRRRRQRRRRQRRRRQRRRALKREQASS